MWNQKGHGYPSLKDWLKVIGVIVKFPVSIPTLLIIEKIKDKKKVK